MLETGKGEGNLQVYVQESRKWILKERGERRPKRIRIEKVRVPKHIVLMVLT